MSHPLDHLLWAVPELAAGIARFEALTGVGADPGGSHPDFGTRNALAALEGDVYLEIIAPDPAQDLTGTRGETLAALPDPRLLTFAVRSDDLDRVAELATAAGLDCGDPLAMSRRTPDGGLLRWRVLRLDGGRFGELVPFFIDWGDTPHPSRTTVRGCRLEAFEVAHPQRDELARIYRALELDIVPLPADEPGLRALLATPNGEVVLTG